MNRNIHREKLAPQREFGFTSNDFSRIRELIYERAGIKLGSSKEEMVYSRIARRLRATGFRDFESYLSWLEREKMNNEWELFTNALTTNLTAFFREAQHFPILAEHARRNNANESYTVWCSASSTGEEAYSIAITLCEVFNTLKPPVNIIATDIDTNVLKTAANAVYPADRIDMLTNEQVRRFFLKGTGKRAGMVRVRKELRDLITFRQLNLLDESWPLRPPLDAIFCRNVMIYFDKSTQGKILSRFAPLLKPDGLLFAGHSENFMYVTKAFKLAGKTVYKLAADDSENKTAKDTEKNANT